MVFKHVGRNQEDVSGLYLAILCYIHHGGLKWPRMRVLLRQNIQQSR